MPVQAKKHVFNCQAEEFIVEKPIVHPAREDSRVCGGLYGGSIFKGSQKSGKNSYEVTVELQAEIIGPHYSFLTRKWDADYEIDKQHWTKFPSFGHWAATFNKDGFTFDHDDGDFVYMRWKEQFLVPDHSIKSITGASYQGYYYICYQKSKKSVIGFYFHQNSEWFQYLTLEHIPQHDSACKRILT